MKSPKIKILRKAADQKAMADLEKEVNEALGLNFEVLKTHVSESGHVTFVLFDKGQQDYVKAPTAYPSEKQAGYVCWAYDIHPTVFEKAKLSRKECSVIIEDPKQNGNGKPYNDGVFEAALSDLRGSAEKTESESEFDDDIPF